ncbi:MAG: hypothetical protein IPK98_03160 [Chloracidobacterium sp.]|nr:hypothetical protein [Chloracidobacterium sp.]
MRTSSWTRIRWKPPSCEPKKYADKNGEEAPAATSIWPRSIATTPSSVSRQQAKNTIAAIAEGDEGRTLIVALKRFTKNNSPVNTIAARQRIADAMIQANTYIY